MYPPQGKSLYKFLRQSKLRTTLLRCAAGKQGAEQKTALAWAFFFYLYTQVFASRFLGAAHKWCIPSTRLTCSSGWLEIGRASCRERGETWDGAGGVSSK